MKINAQILDDAIASMNEPGADLQYAKALYEGDRTNKNLLSYWFPKIENVKGLKVPKTVTIDVPVDIFAAIVNDEIGKNLDQITEFVKTEIAPKITSHVMFIKNGCFSNKFDFRHSITNRERILDDFLAIQYASACLGTGGISEINLREVIPHNPAETAAIYGGMPLRTEIRVFYDFDERKILYSANYWDYDYVRPNLHERSDKIIFDACKDEIQNGYEQNREAAESAVNEAMRDVELTGRWSVDILIDEKGGLWLIDMAVAERSAYWDKSKADANK